MKVEKRKYCSPNLEEYHVDNDISLILMTGETQPPDPPRGTATQQSSSSLQDNPFEENNLK